MLQYIAGEPFNRQGEERIFTSAPTAEAPEYHLLQKIPKQLQQLTSNQALQAFVSTMVYWTQ